MEKQKDIRHIGTYVAHKPTALPPRIVVEPESNAVAMHVVSIVIRLPDGRFASCHVSADADGRISVEDAGNMSAPTRTTQLRRNAREVSGRWVLVAAGVEPPDADCIDNAFPIQG